MWYQEQNGERERDGDGAHSSLIITISPTASKNGGDLVGISKEGVF
jgi:hypothetical protein